MWKDWPYLLADIVRYGFVLRGHVLDLMSQRRIFMERPPPGVRYKHTKAVKLRWYFYLTIIQGSYSCIYCKKPFNKYLMPSIDHKIPLAKDGVDAFDNYVMACEWCNRRKSVKLEYDTELAQRRANNRYYYSRRKKYQKLKDSG